MAEFKIPLGYNAETKPVFGPWLPYSGPTVTRHWVAEMMANQPQHKVSWVQTWIDSKPWVKNV